MLNVLIRGGMIPAVLFCAVLFSSCGITPLYYPPVDEKSPEEMFDGEVCSALLEAGRLQSEDGDVTISFGEYREDGKKDSPAAKNGFEKSIVRGMMTIVERDKETPAETWLPVLLVPFRHADALFFHLTLDNMCIMEKQGLNPQYVFMSRPYSYLLKAERSGDCWEVGFVQFATSGLEVKKVAEQAQIDKDGTVFNPPGEILDMLKDPKNYELASKLVFRPVKSPDGPEAEAAR